MSIRPDTRGAPNYIPGGVWSSGVLPCFAVDDVIYAPEAHAKLCSNGFSGYLSFEGADSNSVGFREFCEVAAFGPHILQIVGLSPEEQMGGIAAEGGITAMAYDALGCWSVRFFKSDAVDVVPDTSKIDLSVALVVFRARPEPAIARLVESPVDGAALGAIEFDMANALKGVEAVAASSGLCGHARSVANQNGHVNVH